MTALSKRFHKEKSLFHVLKFWPKAKNLNGTTGDSSNDFNQLLGGDPCRRRQAEREAGACERAGGGARCTGGPFGCGFLVGKNSSGDGWKVGQKCMNMCGLKIRKTWIESILKKYVNLEWWEIHLFWVG